MLYMHVAIPMSFVGLVKMFGEMYLAFFGFKDLKIDV